MLITAALCADLALLTQALDRPVTEIVETLRQLSVDARSAVPSCVGLSMISAGPEAFTLTVLEDRSGPEDVRSSLLVRLPRHGSDEAAPGGELVLYAARAGAFVDLAADLSRLTGRTLSDDVLDQHLPPAALVADAPTVQATSAINQAIGVLVGRGRLPSDADGELTERAADRGTDRYAVALGVLATLGDRADLAG